MKRSKEERVYPFWWVEEVLSVTFNPAIAEFHDPSAQTLSLIKEELQRQLLSIRLSLMERMFSLDTAEQVTTVYVQYHATVAHLIGIASINHGHLKKSDLTRVAVGELIGELKTFQKEVATRYLLFRTELEKQETGIPVKTVAPVAKILCSLSVDQLAIVLKAADEARVILSRSLSLIFKTIVPYLSTEHKKDLSWDSMRSNSYHAEDSDKQAAIDALKKMIDKIATYR